jgi:antitoxin component YwqK of YwqJK toxin-antitoxin module
MKILVALFALAAFASAIPAKRITNRQFPDGSGSSLEHDPAKRQSVETFYAINGKVTHKILRQLDERLQPLSGIHYDAQGRIYQKSSYRLDGEDRIIQEVIYDGKGNLVCTKNYNYGTRNGRATVVDVDTYDANGNLIVAPKQSRPTKRTR